MHHFFSQEIDGNQAFLSEEESRHCTKVMRLGVGQEVMLFDGRGQQYRCVISSDRKRVELEIQETIHLENEPKLSLTLAVSPTKSADRMEWMVEKLVEIGITRLVFLKTEKGERSRINTKRLEKKAVSALKQSGNVWLPEIETEVKFQDFITKETSESRFVAHCFDSEKSQINSTFQCKNVCILIGPEGDFSEKEVQQAREAEFVPLSLGLPRYRTETAAVVASTLINHFCVTLAQ